MSEYFILFQCEEQKPQKFGHKICPKNVTNNKLPGTVLVKETQKHKKMADAEDHSLQDVSDNSFEIIVTKLNYISLKIQFIHSKNRKKYVFKKFLFDGHIMLLEDDEDSKL